MATELSVDIVARFQDVQRQLTQAQKGFDALEKEIRQVGKSATVAGNQVEKASDNITRSTAKMNRGFGNTSSVAFQAGQAISDFSVAGIRGAANNIEFLALQLGLNSPLILGITAATVALTVFSDEIRDAFAPDIDFDQLTADVKGVADELVRIRDGVKVTFEGTADELEKDAERIGRIVDALTEHKNNIQKLLTREQTQQIGGVTTFLADSPAIRVLQGDLEAVETILARQLGIQESITESAEEQRLLEQVIADLSETTLERTEEEGNRKRTQLDRAIEANNRLKEQLEALRNIEGSRLGLLLSQNQQLQEQIKIVRRINEARSTGLIGGDLRELAGQGLSQEGAVTPLGDLIEGINRRRSRERRQQLTGLRLLDPGTVEEIESASERSVMALQELAAQSEQLGQSIQQGIGGAFASLATSIGEGENLFDGLRNAVGGFAIDIGQTMIGFGISGLALKRFIVDPVTAIVAGGGLVALGAALKKSVSSKTESFTTTGAIGSDRSSLSPLADPRQGRDGRFRRNFESGFQPIHHNFQSAAIMSFDFRIAGEDLVASNRRATQRQNRTRATSSRSSLSNRG